MTHTAGVPGMSEDQQRARVFGVLFLITFVPCTRARFQMYSSFA